MQAGMAAAGCYLAGVGTHLLLATPPSKPCVLTTILHCSPKEGTTLPTGQLTGHDPTLTPSPKKENFRMPSLGRRHRRNSNTVVFSFTSLCLPGAQWSGVVGGWRVGREKGKRWPAPTVLSFPAWPPAAAACAPTVCPSPSRKEALARHRRQQTWPEEPRT